MNPNLYVEFQPSEQDDQDLDGLTGAHGLVIDPATVNPRKAERLPSPVRVLRTAKVEDAGAWRELRDVVWVSDAGLEDTLHLRDTWPELAWVPRLAVFKPQVRYQLLDTFPGEGFKMYMPDTAALRGYQVMGDDTTLRESLARAAKLGFNTLWLHALDAEERGKGLDLDLLEHARAQFGGELWLSGGATRERHLANLAIHKGAAAVVIPTALAKQYGCERLLSVLATPPTTGIPLRFVAKPTSVSKNCG